MHILKEEEYTYNSNTIIFVLYVPLGHDRVGTWSSASGQNPIMCIGFFSPNG